MILRHYMELLRYHRKVFVAFVLGSMMVFASVSVIKLKISPTFVATVRLIITPTAEERMDARSSEGRRALKEQYIEFLKSRPVIQGAWEGVLTGTDVTAEESGEEIGSLPLWRRLQERAKGLAKKASAWLKYLDSGTVGAISPEEKQIERVRNAIEVRTLADADVLQVEVSWADPEIAADLANMLADAYVDQVQRQRIQATNRRQKLLGDEIEQRSASVAKLQAQQEIARINDQARGIKARIASLEERRGFLERELKGTNQLSRMRADLKVAEERYSDRHPDVVRLKRAIKEAEKEGKKGIALDYSDESIDLRKVFTLQNELSKVHSDLKEQRMQLAQLREDLHTYEPTLAQAMKNADATEQLKKAEMQDQARSALLDLEPKFTSSARQAGMVPEVGAMGVKHMYELQIEEGHLSELHDLKFAAEVARVDDVEEVRIIEPARVPVYPSSPRVLYNTSQGLLTGLVLGIIFIVLRDNLSEKITTSVDLERVVGNRAIGVIDPTWVEKRKWQQLRKLGKLIEQHLAILGGLESPVTPSRPTRVQPLPFIEPVEYHYEENHRDQSEGPFARALVRLNMQSERVIDNGDDAPVLQVTGFSSMLDVCWATVGLAGALAIQGRRVVCRLPEGVMKKYPRALDKLPEGVVECQPASRWDSGHTSVVRPDVAWHSDNTIVVQALGPVSAQLTLKKPWGEPIPTVICTLPANTVSESTAQALQQRAASSEDYLPLYFVLTRT